jgi:hypothetical protein
MIAVPDAELSTEVQDLLQEIYFTCQFHASMLFHRPTFICAFEAGQVPRYVLLALYSNSIMSVHPNDDPEKANAGTNQRNSSFLPETSLLYHQNQRLLTPLGDLKALGHRWALEAGRTVLQDIDQPKFTGAQVCEILALYWFSQGEFQRHTMFLSRVLPLLS